MKRTLVFWLMVSALILLVLPWLAAAFVKEDGGMAACLILFFAVNPLYFVVLGASAGKNMRCLWCLPVLSAVLFLAGTWIFFDMGETAFVMYAGVYLILGMCSMGLSALIRKKSR